MSLLRLLVDELLRSSLRRHSLRNLPLLLLALPTLRPRPYGRQLLQNMCL